MGRRPSFRSRELAQQKANAAAEEEKRADATGNEKERADASALKKSKSPPLPLLSIRKPSRQSAEGAPSKPPVPSVAPTNIAGSPSKRVSSSIPVTHRKNDKRRDGKEKEELIRKRSNVDQKQGKTAEIASKKQCRTETHHGEGAAIGRTGDPAMGRSPSVPPQPVPSGSLYTDSEAAANLLAQVAHTEDCAIDLNGLSQSEAYKEMALRGTKFIAYLNRMVGVLDSEIREKNTRVEEANKLAKDEKGKRWADQREASKTISDLRSELAHSKTKREEADRRCELLELTKAENEAKIVELRRTVNAANEAHESQLSRAVITAKRDVERKFAERISRAKKRLDVLDDEVKRDMLDLTEIDANIELIELFMGDKAPTFAEELANLKARNAEKDGSHERWDRKVAELQTELTLPSRRRIALVESSDEEPIELSAARVGIRELSGSNAGTPGLSEFILRDGAESLARLDSPKGGVSLVHPVVAVSETAPDAPRRADLPEDLAVPLDKVGDATEASADSLHPDPSSEKIAAIEELADKDGTEVAEDGGVA